MFGTPAIVFLVWSDPDGRHAAQVMATTTMTVGHSLLQLSHVLLVCSVYLAHVLSRSCFARCRASCDWTHQSCEAMLMLCQRRPCWHELVS